MYFRNKLITSSYLIKLLLLSLILFCIYTRKTTKYILQSKLKIFLTSYFGISQITLAKKKSTVKIMPQELRDHQNYPKGKKKKPEEVY